MATITRQLRLEVTNPFRDGSKLNRVFDALVDGQTRSIDAVTRAVYSTAPYPFGKTTPVQRRRTASAIRTIRQHLERKNIGSVRCSNEGYRMIIR